MGRDIIAGIENHDSKYIIGLGCPICYCDYQPKTKIPKKLGCGHVLCQDCLKKDLIWDYNKCYYQIKCHECR